MPMIDAFIPKDALSPSAEQELLSTVTDLVVKYEIGDPANERGQNSSWIFVHRPEIFVAGAPATAPRYRFIVSVPEGQFDDERRQGVIAEVTAAIAKAENRSYDDVKARVWVIANEIPDGNWGSRGQVMRLPEILTYLLGESGRQTALERLAKLKKGW